MMLFDYVQKRGMELSEGEARVGRLFGNDPQRNLETLRDLAHTPDLCLGGLTWWGWRPAHLKGILTPPEAGGAPPPWDLTRRVESRAWNLFRNPNVVRSLRGYYAADLSDEARWRGTPAGIFEALREAVLYPARDREHHMDDPDSVGRRAFVPTEPRIPPPESSRVGSDGDFLGTVARGVEEGPGGGAVVRDYVNSIPSLRSAAVLAHWISVAEKNLEAPRAAHTDFLELSSRTALEHLRARHYCAEGIHFHGVLFQDMDFSQCFWTGCLFEDCIFYRCRFDRCALRHCIFKACLLEKCTFERCLFALVSDGCPPGFGHFVSRSETPTSANDLQFRECLLHFGTWSFEACNQWELTACALSAEQEGALTAQRPGIRFVCRRSLLEMTSLPARRQSRRPVLQTLGRALDAGDCVEYAYHPQILWADRPIMAPYSLFYHEPSLVHDLLAQSPRLPFWERIAAIYTQIMLDVPQIVRDMFTFPEPR